MGYVNTRVGDTLYQELAMLQRKSEGRCVWTGPMLHSSTKNDVMKTLELDIVLNLIVLSLPLATFTLYTRLLRLVCTRLGYGVAL